MEVRRARSREELDAALALRRIVFSDEQGVPPEADLDGHDDEAVHVVALDGERVIGTLRLWFVERQARLGRMVVDAEARGRGVAARMLALADELTVEGGADHIVLHAQLTARSVYERAGYTAHGEVFDEEGIDHVSMDKRVG